MARTFDKINQDFDNETLYAFGFNEDFIWIIWECNLSVSYSISLNGSPFVEIIPARRFRQGKHPLATSSDKENLHLFIFLLWGGGPITDVS